ncbi:MAG: twin-arginine translocase subunit TatC [Candidatus Limnocylindria bacterium]
MAKLSGERDKELSLLQHLGELRQRLTVAAFAILITTVISFLFAGEIIRILILPSGLERLLIINPTEGFTTYMRVALFSGIALAMPVILYEVYAYVDPALHPRERRFVLALGPFILLLFVGGMLFSYFVLLPQALRFLINFGGDVFEPELRAGEYIGFVTTLILAMGLVFQTPALIFAVVKVGVVRRSWLVRQRRYVFLLVFVIAAVITPTPDPLNQSLVAIPMYLLWELGLLLARAAGEPRDAP